MVAALRILPLLIDPYSRQLPCGRRWRNRRCRDISGWTRSGRGRLRIYKLQRLDESNNLQQLLFAYLSLEGWHDGAESGDQFGLRIYDRFANVGFVRSSTLAGFQID